MDPQAEPDLTRLRRNPLLICGFHAVHMGMFPIAILTLFLRDIGLSMFDVFVLQAIFAAMIAALEFPSGYLADRIGYRPTLIVGAALQVIGWFGYVAADGFASALAAELVLAVSLSMISGADSALLYESLLGVGDERLFARWFGRYRSLGNLAEGSAALIGSLVFVHAPRLPFALQSGLWLIAIALGYALLEPVRDRGPVSSTRERMQKLVRYAALDAPRLRAIVALLVTLMLPAYAMVWILPTYVEAAGVSAGWLGPIWAAASYTVALGSIGSTWLGRRFGLHATLALCIALIAVAYLGLGLTHAWYGFGFYFALCLARGVQLPLLHHEEQRLIPSSDRASLLSLNSLVFRGTFALTGPIIGYALDHADHHDVLLWMGALFFAASASAWLSFVAARELPGLPRRSQPAA